VQLGPAGPNPFATLSLIVAPAVLTNASTILVLSTSNRLARAVDRARELTALGAGAGADAEGTELRMCELRVTDQRALLLLRALRWFYGALAGFAAGTFLSLVGAVLVGRANDGLTRLLEVLALAGGVVAVGALVMGSALLLRETHLAVEVLRANTADLEARLRR
jgi:hypothetical protein